MGIFLCGFIPALIAAGFIAWWFIYHNVFYPKTCEKWDDEKKTWFNNGNKVALALYHAGDGWLGVVTWIILIVCGAVALVFAGWMTWTATHIAENYQKFWDDYAIVEQALEENNIEGNASFVSEYMEKVRKIQKRDNFMWKFVYNYKVVDDVRDGQLIPSTFQNKLKEN